MKVFEMAITATMADCFLGTGAMPARCRHGWRQRGASFDPSGRGLVQAQKPAFSHFRSLAKESLSTVFKRILTVCVGNICRSPTAEYLLRQHLLHRDIRVRSAGLGALAGRPMEAMALQLLAEHGIDGRRHTARQLTPAMLREADLVLGMERAHVDAMTRLAPEASGKIFVFDKWLLGRDIPDPYRQERIAFEHVYGMITQATESWLHYL